MKNENDQQDPQKKFHFTKILGNEGVWQPRYTYGIDFLFSM